MSFPRETLFNASTGLCPGTRTRRAFVCLGQAGVCSLGLPELLRLQTRGQPIRELVG